MHYGYETNAYKIRQTPDYRELVRFCREELQIDVRLCDVSSLQEEVIEGGVEFNGNWHHVALGLVRRWVNDAHLEYGIAELVHEVAHIVFQPPGTTLGRYLSGDPRQQEDEVWVHENAAMLAWERQLARSCGFSKAAMTSSRAYQGITNAVRDQEIVFGDYSGRHQRRILAAGLEACREWGLVDATGKVCREALTDEQATSIV